MDNFSNRLKEAIQIRRTNANQVSLNANLSRGAISNYLAGRYEPKQTILFKIAKALNVSEAWLMGYDVPMERQNNIDKAGVHVNDSVLIPVFATIPAGVPYEMIEDIKDYEEIPASMLKGGAEYFGLQVNGLSMYPKYWNNDIIIVKSQNVCESGDDAIVSIGNDDATLKKVILLDNGIMLQPINPEYQSIIYTNKEIKLLPVKILGVVKEIRRKL